MADLLLIVNPGSGGGSTGRHWPAIEQKLRDGLPAFDVAFTERPGHATAIARERAGRYSRVAVMGGDGTNNEVLNGLVLDDQAVNQNLIVGFIRRGTGGDFARGLGIPKDLEMAAERLVGGEVREADIGKVVYRAFDGSEATRYFLNEASIGMGAVVCEWVNRNSKSAGARLTYVLGILAVTPRYRSQPVDFSFDGVGPVGVLLNNAWVANGRYSGGGIMSAPRARTDDGLLDVVTIPHMKLWRRLTSFGRLRSGSFVEMPEVEYRTARRVEMRSDQAVHIETDGEPIGMLPATFEVLTGRLKIVA